MKLIVTILSVLVVASCWTKEKPMEVSYPEFLKEWNFQDPAKTREKFLEIQKQEALNASENLELKTQIARTYGLQSKFDEADKQLDEVEQQMADDLVVQIRYNLERGRVLNSSGKKEEALKYFKKAWEISKDSGYGALAVDAAHMVAIAEKDPADQLAWNEIALKHAESSKDKAAKKWLGSLYNNIGWTYHDMKKFDEALKHFEKALEYQKSKGDAYHTGVAKWTVARALRSLRKIDEALDIQLALEKANEASKKPDGYNFEELGELYVLKNNKTKSKSYFRKAHELLSKDGWFVKNEAERFKRITEFSK